MLKSLILLSSTLFLLQLPLHGLNVVTNGIKNGALFGIEFPGGSGSYNGHVPSVHSISKHEYIVASFKVHEVNIVTEGSALLRIYYSRPLKASEIKDAAADAAEASGTPGSSIIKTPLPSGIKTATDRVTETADSITSDIVYKDYPVATHAHTIEFRVSSREELESLHAELKKHWLKEPGYFEKGQLSENDGNGRGEVKPRNLGGTIFIVEG